jgi:hypothetical protein
MTNGTRGAATAAPSGLLASLEAIIERGLEAYREAGRALKAIRDGGHYKAQYPTFEAYCEQRWAMSRSRAYRLIEGAETADQVTAPSAESVSQFGHTAPAPATEGVARELKGTPEAKKEAWTETVKRHGSKPTAKQTRKVVKEKVQQASAIPNPPQNTTNGNGNGSAPPPPPPRKHKPLEGRAAISHDPRVIDWVRGRYDAGWTREQIVAASVAGTGGWPLPGEVLSNGTVSECRAVIRERERVEAEGKPPVGFKGVSGGRRIREIREIQKRGNRNVLYDVRLNLAKLIAATEIHDISNYADEVDELVTSELSNILDELIWFQVWMDRTTSFILGRADESDAREKIRHLREDQAGFEPAECERRNEVADKLERRLNNRLAK